MLEIVSCSDSSAGSNWYIVMFEIFVLWGIHGFIASDNMIDRGNYNLLINIWT